MSGVNTIERPVLPITTKVAGLSVRDSLFRYDLVNSTN